MGVRPDFGWLWPLVLAALLATTSVASAQSTGGSFGGGRFGGGSTSRSVGGGSGGGLNRPLRPGGGGGTDTSWQGLVFGVVCCGAPMMLGLGTLVRVIGRRRRGDAKQRRR